MSTWIGIARFTFFFFCASRTYAIISATCAADVDFGSVMWESTPPAPPTRMSTSFFQCGCE